MESKLLLKILSVVAVSSLVLLSNCNEPFAPVSPSLERFRQDITYDSFTDTRDGTSYRTVTIGTQTWMADNLNYSAGNGSACYDGNPSNCAKYGRLYNWATAMALADSCNTRSCASQVQSKHQGICPSGWHVPSDAEWTILVNYAGGESAAGWRLKSTSGWNYGGNGMDYYGFSALPGGGRWGDGSFNGAGYRGYWWSATENGASYAWYRNMFNDYDNVYRNYYYKTYLFSLRCLKD